MPGKHAPGSSTSFVLSLARAGVGAIAAVALIVAIVLVAVNSRSTDPGTLAGPTPKASTGKSASPKASTSTSASPKASATTSTTAGPTPTQSEAPQKEPLVTRRRLDVEVLNGTGRSGLAASVQDRLNAGGYGDVEVGNAASTSKTTIYYRGAMLREAKRLLKEFPEFKRVREAKSATPGSRQITIVLGTDHEPPAP